MADEISPKVSSGVLTTLPVRHLNIPTNSECVATTNNTDGETIKYGHIKIIGTKAIRKRVNQRLPS